jgi:hypothetical protein
MPTPKSPPHGSKAGDAFVRGLFWILVTVVVVLAVMHLGSAMTVCVGQCP